MSIIKDVISEVKISFDYRNYISSVVYGIKLYEAWFRRVRPYVLIAECYYDYKMMAIYAAKKLGIPTIEFQHGMITEQTFPYICRKKFTDNPFPEWLFCYGEVYKQF